MRHRLRWRHFAGQRFPAQKRLALLMGVTATLVATVALLPSAWQAWLLASMQTCAAQVAALGFRSIWLGAAALLLVLALAVFLASPYRRHAFHVSTSRLVAPVTVYLDAENQLHTSDEVKACFAHLRKFLDGRRADLIFFTDASRMSKTAAYAALYSRGFRPVDVPHAPIGVDATRNLVDMELALYAYQRALLGPTKQEIILISADRDYIPLVYRLHALQHQVHIWAEHVPAAYLALRERIGVGVLDLDAVFANSGARRSSPARVANQATATGALQSAVTTTLSALEAIAQPNQSAEERIRLVCERLEMPEHDIPGSLDYCSPHRSRIWLSHLRAVNALHGDFTTVPIGRGPSSPEEAAELLLTLLRQVSDTARMLSIKSTERHVRLATLSSHLMKSSVDAAPDGIEEVRVHLRSLKSYDPNRLMLETECLCRCARALGLLKYESTGKPSVIVVDTVEARSAPPADHSNAAANS